MLADLDLLIAFSCRLLSIHEEIAHVTLEIKPWFGLTKPIALRFVERAFDGGPEEDAPHHLQRLAEHRFVQASPAFNPISNTWINANS
jgi:hypothetical protein